MLVVVVGAVAGFVVATRRTGPKYATFRDKVNGFSVTYPAEWISHSNIDPTLRLFLRVTADSQDSFTARVDQTQAEIKPSDLVAMKSFTDAVISGSHPNVLEQGPITLGGLQGYFYRYTLADQSLIHFHYFVFQDHKMISLVLQAAPSDLAAHGGRLAAQFDLLRASIQAAA